MPAPVLGVTSSCTITTFAPTALVDVVTGISGLAVIDDAFTDRGCPVPSWGRLGMNRCLFLLSRGLRRLLWCQPTAPRGGTLGLLHGRSLKETSNLIVGLTGLRGRWFGHVAEKHGGGDDVLASSVEDRGFTRPILDDATVDVAGSLSSSSATYARRALPLEGLVK
jgi:hypothetical protein